jgi:hypothetical protein
MTNESIRKEWESFVSDEKYKKYFFSDEEVFKMTLSDVKNYIDTNHKKPSRSDKDKNIKSMGNWLSTQQQNYKNKEHNMENESIRKEWESFVSDEKYKKYFFSDEEVWKMTLSDVKKYIDTNKKKPSPCDKDKNIKSLGDWLSKQQQNYKNKEHNMKNESIRKEWESFVSDEKYKKYFVSNEEQWKMTLIDNKKYIDTNEKRPSRYDKDKNIKSMGYWLSNQQKNYKKKTKIMKNESIRKEWESFVSDEKYKKYFR